MSTVRRPCPQCDRGPKDTALAVTNDDRGTVSYCHRCGYTASDAASVKTAFRAVDSRPEPAEWSARAEFIWCRTLPVAGSLGAIYLQERGCVLPPKDTDLRFLPATESFPPRLCARITDVLTGRPISLHFTTLAADGRGKAGTERDKLLLKGHRKSGGCIRLWPGEAVTRGLAIAEGIESALAAAHLFTPIWAAVDAGNLASLAVLPGVEALTIFADNDTAGIRAAQECAARWRAAGRDVRVLASRTAGHDAADEVRHDAA